MNHNPDGTDEPIDSNDQSFDELSPPAPTPKSQQEQLHRELQTIHELLEDVEEVNPETKEAMRSVAEDISRLLDPESGVDDWTQIDKRWRDAVLNFESQHPRLAQAVDQITNLLASVGF